MHQDRGCTGGPLLDVFFDITSPTSCCCFLTGDIGNDAHSEVGVAEIGRMSNVILGASACGGSDLDRWTP